MNGFFGQWQIMSLWMANFLRFEWIQIPRNNSDALKIPSRWLIEMQNASCKSENKK